jgi:hypothetical protein
MMNDDLTAIAGRYRELVGRLQERYGIARKEARERVDDLKEMVDQFKKTNRNRMELQNMSGSKRTMSITPTKKRAASRKKSSNGKQGILQGE